MDPKYAEKIFPKPSHYVECCLHEILSLASKCHNEIETHQNQAISSYLLLSSFCQPVWNATLCQSSVVKRICWLFKNHCYADDIQLYITIFKSQCVSKVLSVQNCFNCIKSRMSDNFYSQQNENKTQIFSCISQKPDAVHQNIVFLRLKTPHPDE